MAEAPKLYTNKPKKAQLKQFQGKDFSSPSSSSSSMGTQPPHPPPPQPPKESFARRYKFLWPLLLTVNLAVGAYIFMRTKKKETDVELVDEVATPVQTTAAVTVPLEKSLPSPAIKEPPPKLREPISGNQQRELFKWILEEKRKVRTNDPEERKRIDEEKALLKQFIRAKSVPSI
ncbi:uncharacterized protein LOC133794459 [Humulus lupulus]|uniref:uncharacterized protein LOC133794459 n=1 Tax=Humulus lupulus TaxID=3486 RepID=UPI002B412774|nr:uncharacterized protein LOC133794459 [Humulus lupulus]